MMLIITAVSLIAALIDHVLGLHLLQRSERRAWMPPIRLLRLLGVGVVWIMLLATLQTPAHIALGGGVWLGSWLVVRGLFGLGSRTYGRLSRSRSVPSAASAQDATEHVA